MFILVCPLQDAIEGYKQVHPGFEGTRELKLVQVYMLGTNVKPGPF